MAILFGMKQLLWRGLAPAFFVWTFFAASLAAQSFPVAPNSGTARAGMEQLMEAAAPAGGSAVRGSGASSLMQEGPIDPSEYVVGPGDLMLLSVGGPAPQAIELPVLPDGSMVLLDAGRLSVSGISLAAVQARAEELVKPLFGSVPIHISLAQPRMFMVHVVGLVTRAGRYPASSVMRVDDLLEDVVLDSSALERDGMGPIPDVRNIVIERRDGSFGSADLLRYHRSGNLDANPLLRDGDIVRIPGRRRSDSVVFLRGNVTFPGAVPYRADDTIASLIELSTGHRVTPEGSTDRAGSFCASASACTIRLDGPDGTASFAGDELTEAVLSQSVAPGTSLSVGTLGRPQGQVTLSGMVAYPGAFAIEVGKTTLSDVLSQGAVHEDAVVATITRAGYVPPVSTTNVLLSTEMEQVLARSSAGAVEGEQIVQAVTYEGSLRVPLSVAATFPLADGDDIAIERAPRSVRVVGQVVSEGRFPHQTGQTVADYLSAAGGITRTSSSVNTYVLSFATGQTQPAAVSDGIGPGDVIIVTDRDLARSTQTAALVNDQARIELERKSRRTQSILMGLQVASSLLTTYLFIVNQR